MSVRRVALAVLAAALILPAAASAADSCAVPKKLGVAFSLDDSGSMATSDPGKLRLEATRAGMDQMPDGAVVAVSSFDTYSRSEVDPTVLSAANRDELKGKVWGSAYGNTDYELGFSKAKEHLDAMADADKRALIFLSDGAPSYSYSTNDTIADAGIPIYTIGFNDAPPATLAAIAAESGGQAFTVQSPGQAQAVFARIISSLTCDASKFTGQVDLAPGETRSFPFAVAADDGEYKALAAWYGGDVTVTVTRPDTSVMAPGALRTGESFINAATYASIGAVGPPAGDWSLNVTASPDNFSNVSVSIDVWKRVLVQAHPMPPPPPAPVPLKVAGVGDSIAAGFGLDLSGIPGQAKLIACAARMPTGDCDSPAKAWPTLAAGMLPASVTGGRPVATTNYAVSGTSTTDWLNGRKTALTQVIAEKPDVVLMTLGANNILQNQSCFKDPTCWPKLLSESRKVIARELPDMLSRLLVDSPNTAIWLTNYYTVPVDKFGIVESLNGELRLARQKLGDALSGRVHIVPVPKLAGGTCHAAMPYLLGGKDGCLHPNPAGHQLLAQSVVNAMNGASAPDANAKSSRLSSLDIVTPAIMTGVTFSGFIVVKITSAVGNAARKVTAKFVSGIKGLLSREMTGSAHTAKTRTKSYIVHGTLRYHRGVATLKLKVPKAARKAGTRVYLKLGRVKVGGKRYPATKFVAVGALG